MISCEKNNILIFFLTIFFAFLMEFGFLNFEVWGQIKDYRSVYESNGGFFFSPHILRYIVIHPVYQISSVFELDLNATYSWYVLFSAFCVSKIWASVRKSFLRPKSSFSFLVSIPFFILLLINGRFIFGLLGLSILLMCISSLEVERFKVVHIFIILFGVLLTSVSSGIFFVGTFFVICSIYSIYRRRPSFIGLPVKILLLIPLSIITYFGFIFFEKNYSYFASHAGGVFGAFGHGVGFLLVPDTYKNLCELQQVSIQCSVFSVFNGDARIILILIIAIFLMLAFYFDKKLNIINPIAARGLIISMLGGIFGFTTLLSFVFVIPILFLRKI